MTNNIITQEFLEKWVKDNWENAGYGEDAEALAEEFGGYWHSESVYDFHHDIIFPYCEDLMEFLKTQRMTVFKITSENKEFVNWFVFPSHKVKAEE